MSIFQNLPYELIRTIVSYTNSLEHHIKIMIKIYHNQIVSYRIKTSNPLYCPYTGEYYCLANRTKQELQMIERDLAIHKNTTLRNYINHKIKQHFMIYYDYTPYLYFGLSINSGIIQSHRDLSKEAMYNYLAEYNYFF
jgi:hypothetical protein